MLSACGGSSSTQPVPETSPPAPEQTPFEVRVAILNSELAPLDSTLPGPATDDLLPLSRLAAARVIGMGEATHGTREFFHLKHKIFRWLVEEHGATVFAIESDIAEGYFLDQYVQTGEGDLESMMLERMHYWTWYTEEVRDLIQWMADYNAANPDAEPLRYIGIDCQTVGMQPEAMMELINVASPELSEQVEAAISPLDVGMYEAWPFYQEMPQQEYDQIRAQLLDLQATLAANRDELVAGATLQDYHMLMYLLKSLIDGHRSTFDDFNVPDLQPRSEARERCMADNVQLIEDLAGPGVRVGLWAHNGHVAATPYFQGWPTMGSHLREELGNEYQVIGFSFSHGDFMAQRSGVGLLQQSIPLPPLPGSITELLHAADSEQYILDVGGIPGSQLLDWLRESQLFLFVGSVFDPAHDIQNYYYDVTLSPMFDAIIHIDESTAAVPLPMP